MAEGRLNFSDYSAKEQKADSIRRCLRQVYALKVDGVWSHFAIIDGKDNYDFYDGKDIADTYFELKARFPEHQVRVIQNKGIENYLRDKRAEKERKKQQAIDARQLKINFGERE